MNTKIDVTYEIVGTYPNFDTLRKAVAWIRKVGWSDSNITVWYGKEERHWLYYRDGKIIVDA